MRTQPLEWTSRTLASVSLLNARSHAAGMLLAGMFRSATAILMAMLLDVVWPLPAGPRAVFVGMWLGYLTVISVKARRMSRRSRKNPEQIARQIELLRPDLDNALIHSLQFEGSPTGDAEEAAFLHREIERAENAASGLDAKKLVDLKSVKRERKRLAFLLLLLAGIGICFPRFFRFELPRFSGFWQDRPPFTLTDFRVSPGNIVLPPGGSFTVTVQTSGAEPHSMELICGTNLSAQASVALLPDGNGSYSGKLSRLNADTWYYALSDTGRSPRYQAQVASSPRLRMSRSTAHRHAPPMHSSFAERVADPHNRGVVEAAEYRSTLRALGDVGLAATDIASQLRQDLKSSRRNGRSEPFRPMRYQTAARALQTRIDEIAKQVRQFKRRTAGATGKGSLRQHLKLLDDRLSNARTVLHKSEAAPSAKGFNAAARAMQLALSAAPTLEQMLRAQGTASRIRRIASGPDRGLQTRPALSSQAGKPKATDSLQGAGGQRIPGAEASRAIRMPDGTGYSHGGEARAVQGISSAAGNSAAADAVAGRSSNAGKGSTAEVSHQAGEKIPDRTTGRRPRGVNAAAARYPSEYRGLVRDYFKAVGEGK